MNWKNIIQDLMSSGMTQAQIARACDAGQSHISALRNGVRKCPNWRLGEALLNLHRNLPSKSDVANNDKCACQS